MHSEHPQDNHQMTSPYPLMNFLSHSLLFWECSDHSGQNVLGMWISVVCRNLQSQHLFWWLGYGQVTLIHRKYDAAAVRWYFSWTERFSLLTAFNCQWRWSISRCSFPHYCSFSFSVIKLCVCCLQSFTPTSTTWKLGSLKYTRLGNSFKPQTVMHLLT